MEAALEGDFPVSVSQPDEHWCAVKEGGHWKVMVGGIILWGSSPLLGSLKPGNHAKNLQVRQEEGQEHVPSRCREQDRYLLRSPAPRARG